MKNYGAQALTLCYTGFLARLTKCFFILQIVKKPPFYAARMFGNLNTVSL
jgi:hypothetical protein